MNAKDLETDILSLSDQRLSLITNRAAIEFDSAARGEPIGFESSKRLFTFIGSRIGADPMHQNDFSRTDMLTLGLIGESLLDISKGNQKTRVPDIIAEIRRLVEARESVDKKSDEKAALEELRNFCVALNRRIIAERNTIISKLPSNPYKRQICPESS